MSKCTIILITTPSEELAKKIGKALVEQSLVACAQINGPITSIYSWQGEVHNDLEWRLILKAVETNYSNIERIVLDLHSYDTPQIIAIPIKQGYDQYLNWIEDSESTK